MSIEFKIYDNRWEFYETNQDKLQELYNNSKVEICGMCVEYDRRIFVLGDMYTERLRHTIRHELVHAIYQTYYSINKINEELMCELFANHVQEIERCTNYIISQLDERN